MEKIAKPRLLVIGGTGFIGHHLLDATQNDWHVTSISLTPPSSKRFVKSVNYLHLDLKDFEAANAALAGSFDYVVNLGGYIDHTLFKDGGQHVIYDHFFALQNLILILSKKSIKRFVHVGSSDEYGNSPAPQVEEFREQPISPYSFGKLANTHFLQMLYRTERFPAIILRLFLTYGPNQDEKRFLPQVINACLRGEEFAASEGRQLRDFTYVKDVVSAIILALQTKEAEGHVLNIASGEPVSIRSIIETVQKVIGGGRAQYGAIPYRPKENMTLYGSTQKAKQLLGWSSKTTFQAGLLQTIEFAKNDVV